MRNGIILPAKGKAYVIAYPDCIYKRLYKDFGLDCLVVDVGRDLAMIAGGCCLEPGEPVNRIGSVIAGLYGYHDLIHGEVIFFRHSHAGSEDSYLDGLYTDDIDRLMAAFRCEDS